MTEAATWRLVTRGGLYLVALVAAVWLIVQLQSLVFQVFLALIMACAVDPLASRAVSIVRFRVRRPQLGRGPVVLIIFALGGLVVLVITLKVAGVVLGELSSFQSLVSQQAATVQQLAGQIAVQLGLPAELVVAVTNQVEAGLEWIGQVVGALLGVFGSFLNIVFTVIVAIYLATDADRILGWVVSLSPGDSRAKMDATLRHTGQKLGQWVLAQLVVATIVSLLYAVGLYLLGIPYVGFLSLVAFMGEFVPLVGPFISSIPAIFVAFTLTTPAQGVATLVFCLIVEQLENDLIVPKAMSSATTVHPLAVLLAILAGGQLFGPIGALLAVPVATCVSVLLSAWRGEQGQPSTVRPVDGVQPGQLLAHGVRASGEPRSPA